MARKYFKIITVLGVSMTAMVILSLDFVRKEFPFVMAPAAVNQHPFVVDLAERVFYNTTTDSKNSSADIRSSVIQANYHRTGDNSSEICHIGFLKVHKAGSTTMQNMMFRFGLKRNLTFIIPNHGNYFSPRGSMPVKAGGHYDILAMHSIYEKGIYDSILPADKVNIGIVREPLDRMISAAYYYRDVFGIGYLRAIPKASFIQDLVMHPEKYERGYFSETKNSMGKDFGFDPMTKAFEMDKILTRLKLLEKEFKLVLVIERFEESLVLLKRYLKWNMSDIIFLEGNTHKHAEVNLTEAHRAKHKNTCFLDYALYDFFSNILDFKVKAEGDDFQAEVNQFKTVLKQAKSFCDQSKAAADKLEVSATKWNNNFIVSHEDCELMKLGEIRFINNLRVRHLKMNGRSR